MAMSVRSAAALAALLTASLLLPHCAASQTALQVPSQQSDHVKVYSAWNNRYLYLAAVVNKPTLHGTNSTAFSDPLQDDAVVFALQTNLKHIANKPNSYTAVLAASAEGGVQLYRGSKLAPLFQGMEGFTAEMQQVQKITNPAERETRRLALMQRILRFQVTQHGIQRATGAFMPGYTVEIAIPWVDLGSIPTPGMKIGFNVAALSISSDSPAVISWSSKATSRQDVFNPSLWNQMEFETTPAKGSAAMAVCLHTEKTSPVIDGRISQGEWPEQTSLQFGVSISELTGLNATRTDIARIRAPFASEPPRPVIALPAAVLPAPAPHAPQPLPPLTLAILNEGFQGNPRLNAPTQNVTLQSGASALAHHPYNGTGPWLSYRSANWQLSQLTNASLAGIEALLPEFQLTAHGLQPAGALSALARALQYAAQNNLPAPQIGLMLNLKNLPAGSLTPQRLWQAVAVFYSSLPPADRLAVPLSANNGGGMACPLFLQGGEALKNQPGWPDYLRARFAARFHKTDLLLLGTPDFTSKLDGRFTPAGASGGLTSLTGGWMKLVSISPGYDPVIAHPNALSKYQPRLEGAAYRAHWEQALQTQAPWVLLNGWNQFSTASEIAPSLEQGYATADITVEMERRLLGLSQQSAQMLWSDAPLQMQAGEICTIHVLARNTGTQAWGSETPSLPVAWAVRWLRNGRVVGYSPPTPLISSVMPLHNTEAGFPVAALGTDGKPLPPGDYTLQIGLATLQSAASSNPFLGENSPGNSLLLPVTILPAASPAFMQARVIYSSMHSELETASEYMVRLVLRNDGSFSWKPGYRITLRLYSRGEENSLQPVQSADATVLLKTSAAPGAVVSVDVPLPLTRPDGAPLPLANYGADMVQVEIATPHNRGVSIPLAPIAVRRYDFGVDFTGSLTPAQLPAGKRMPVLLSLKNRGVQTWKKEAVALGYHWYYMDGTEVVFNDEITPLTANIAPGASASNLLAWVNVPPYNGLYYLVWDVKVGDTWASTRGAASPNETLVLPIRVINGKLHFVDMSQLRTLPSKKRAHRVEAEAGFDGKGENFPASMLPPYALTDTVPSGLWQANGGKGITSPRHISFRWLPQNQAASQFIACRGQLIDLGKQAGTYKSVHLLLASAAEGTTCRLELKFQEANGVSANLYAIAVPSWSNPALHPGQIGFFSPVHTVQHNTVPGARALYAITIPVSSMHKLIAIRLPNAPQVRIAAITLETH